MILYSMFVDVVNRVWNEFQARLLLVKHNKTAAYHVCNKLSSEGFFTNSCKRPSGGLLQAVFVPGILAGVKKLYTLKQ